MRRNGKSRNRTSYFTCRSLSAVLLALVLAAQVAGCGNAQDAANDSQSEASQGSAGITESEASSEETEDTDENLTEDATDVNENSTGDETTENSEDSTDDGASVEDGSSQSTDSESSDVAAQTEDAVSEGGDAAGDSEELSCRVLYEAVAAEATDGIAMVTEKDECTFLTSSYRELLEDFCYATDPEQVYCVCIVKADSEDSAQSIKAEFDDALMSMQNDMYLTTDEQKVAQAGVTGISGQYVWYISLSDDSSVMSAAEDALEAKLD